MKSTLLLLVIILPATICFSQGLDVSTEKYFAKRVADYSKDYPGVSVSVIQGKSITWQKSFGVSDVNSSALVTTDTKFNIYSTSKYITGLAFLKLVYDGKITLEQKITSIDPDLSEEYNQITIGHLLNHTSGIRHYKGKKDWIKFSSLECGSPREAMDFFIIDPLQAEPGQQETYSTFGMVVASHILEKITGMEFSDAINSLLPFSSPLELDDPNQIKATPYIQKGSKFVVYPNLNAKCKYGGGGFIASSAQLAEAGQMLFSDNLVPLKSVKDLFKEQWKEGESNGIAFASGAGISNESFGRPDVLYIAIGGGSPGGRSYLFVVADLEISVAITANLEGNGDDAYKLAFDLIKKLANIE
jgi:serine beta-lactamase-like protein LACTB, mitochondrial